MQFILITLATGALTFLFSPLWQKLGEKQPSKLHIHHSILGLVLFIVGMIIGNMYLAPFGLGIYISHVLEEIYYCKTSFYKALFVLVTLD